MTFCSNLQQLRSPVLLGGIWQISSGIQYSDGTKRFLLATLVFKSKRSVPQMSGAGPF